MALSHSSLYNTSPLNAFPAQMPCSQHHLEPVSSTRAQESARENALAQSSKKCPLSLTPAPTSIPARARWSSRPTSSTRRSHNPWATRAGWKAQHRARCAEAVSDGVPNASKHTKARVRCEKREHNAPLAGTG